ncbi:glycerol-3-phosphate 1-O-acyltransferase PlsY [Streptococcus suis]
MLVNLILLFIAYLLGSIPSGLWIGQTFFNINIREHGSGNTGTTNTFRILGPKAGTIVFAIDFLKGTLAALLPLMFHSQGISPIVFGLMSVLGHTFPIFAQFKGGKAVATSAGMLLGVAPAFCFYLVLIFTSSLYLTSMVSFSSVLAAALAILGALLFPAIGIILPSYDWLFTIIIVFLGLFVIIRHKENIQRILKKEENLVPFGLNLTKQKKRV